MRRRADRPMTGINGGILLREQFAISRTLEVDHHTSVTMLDCKRERERET
jgi:hypothetical protein